MKNKPVISSTQLVLMMVGSALIFPYTFTPILITPPANQDVWIVLLLSVLYMVILNAPLLFIIVKFKGFTLNQTLETVLGKAPGKILAVPFVLFFIYCQTGCLMISSQFIKEFLIPETPYWALLLYMIVPIVYASYKGAGTIGRLAPFFVIFLIVAVVVFFVFGIDKMNINNIRPVLAESSFLQLNEGAFFTASRYSEILILLVFSYYLKEKSSVKKTYAAAVFVFIVCSYLILLPILLTLGVQFAQHCWSAYYVYCRQVEAFGFLERMQALNVLSWFPSDLLKLTMYNYMASYVFSNIVGAKTHKTFVIPIALLSCAICMFPIMQKTNTFLVISSDNFFPYVILPVSFILPLIIVIVYIIRRKRIKALLAQKIKV